MSWKLFSRNYIVYVIKSVKEATRNNFFLKAEDGKKGSLPICESIFNLTAEIEIVW